MVLVSVDVREKEKEREKEKRKEHPPRNREDINKKCIDSIGRQSQTFNSITVDLAHHKTTI